MECKGKTKRMKEEAPSKKLPPKIYGGDYAANASTPTKAAHDEILSSLLRINNFDSISSIKDESLDIDLSACVTISSASFINGNSLSSTDFWRVLDESAQNNTELNLSADVCRDEFVAPSPSPNASPSVVNVANLSNGSANDNTNSEFNVTFLRPEPPNAFTNSPFKKISTTPGKQPSPDQSQIQLGQTQRKVRLPTPTPGRLKVFKEEPGEEKLQLVEATKAQVQAKVEVSEPEPTPHAFHIFQQQPPQQEEPQRQEQPNEMPPPVAPLDNSSKVDLEVMPPPLYKCLDCNDLVLDNPQLVSAHKAAAHSLRITYVCSECQREFELLAGLKKHLKTHRTEGRKDTWKKCPDCGKCLKLGSMWMHRKIHSDNKKYQCDICGQKFVQKINLTHHARIHSSEKPYECPECQKRFQERSHLQRHQKYHAQTRSYRCEKCGKMYKTERCLKVHNLVHLEQRPFACNVCDKSFISNSKLKQHSNIHTGMRPFKCNYCPRDFTNFPNWLKHTRRRHKVDHKTGEHLENIPSYCSKKSTTTKAQKAAAAAAAATAAAASPSEEPLVGLEAVPQSNSEPVKVTPASNAPAPTPKQTRKKKQPQQAALAALGITLPAGTALQQVHPPPPQTQSSAPARKLTATQSTPIPSLLPTKQLKAKRERKQLVPKQLQQKPTQGAAVSVSVPQIKKEPLIAQGPYLDLHGLSLTSAEELIMEQALEMEESGLYDGPVVSTDIGTSDNAISSEAAAALHFQVKNEMPDELLHDEDFLHKPANGNRLACPSLESSPFSSPASMELAAVSTGSSVGSTSTHVNSSRTTNYYLPAFTLNAQGKLTSCTTTGPGSIGGAVPTQVSMVPLLVPSNQMLPSVDTLLFTTPGNPFFSGKTVTGPQATTTAAATAATSHLT